MGDFVMSGKVAWLCFDYPQTQNPVTPLFVRTAPVGFVDWVAMRDFWLRGGLIKSAISSPLFSVTPVWVNSAVAATQVPPQPGSPAIGGYIEASTGTASRYFRSAYCFLYVPAAFAQFARGLFVQALGPHEPAPMAGAALPLREPAARYLQYVLISRAPNKLPRTSNYACVTPPLGPNAGEFHPPWPGRS